MMVGPVPAIWLQSRMQLLLSRNGNRIADAGVVFDETLAAIYQVKRFVPSLTLVRIGTLLQEPEHGVASLHRAGAVSRDSAQPPCGPASA
jgi:hypothetical protein